MVNLILFLFSFLKFTWFCLILFCLIFFLLNFFCPPILRNYNLYKYLVELFWLCLILFKSTVFVKFFPILHTSFKILTILLHAIYLVLYIYWFLTISFLVLLGSSLFLVSKILILVDLKLHPLQKFLFIKLGKYTHTFFVWTVHSALNIEK